MVTSHRQSDSYAVALDDEITAWLEWRKQEAEGDMAQREQKGNREAKKPKKKKIKTIAAAPSQKGTASVWQPSVGSGKK
jgi:hypothetical protein